ncbi:hypothetical protein WICMUC_004342 [Wickerhamomyces mucosus]|uniref:Protein kinase domain-containing protein n=1 Tax=Wickerhamomyces mucosus TaxID=1378264 RepID=A0A9P8PI46_9ASCO|nr:hypothetical protein WICMUC_004342 [Wickerhamomyces mucosus]
MDIYHDAVDFETIEDQKENIEPTRDGHSATALKSLFTTPNPQLKKKQFEERVKIEESLKDIDELDDPLQPYLDYIQWINNNYPSGHTVESGLIQVLERCSSQFRDVLYYKNDPRYLKVWLNYAKYSENPRDIFVYLSRKEIGKSLALYYEEYANYLEVNNRNFQAEKVYLEGIRHMARPIARLQRRYNEFTVRYKQKEQQQEDLLKNEPQSPVFPVRSALAVKSGGSLFSYDAPKSSQKRKLDVFNDDDEENEKNSPIGRGGWDNLGTSKYRNKENKLEAQPWAGEMLKQNGKSSSLKSSTNKISVFKDDFASHDTSFPVYKIIKTPGKKTEKVDLNFDLLYQKNEEYCIEEILFMMRNNNIKSVPAEEIEVDRPIEASKNLPITNNPLIPKNSKSKKNIESETIHLQIPNLKSKASPTKTFFTKSAAEEVYSMFNQNINDDKEKANLYDEDNEFVYEYTEQLTAHSHQNKTILNDLTEQNPKTTSEIEIPLVECVVNPEDENLKGLLLKDLSPSLSTYNGFYNYSSNMNMCSTLKKNINLKQTRHVFIEFKGNQDTYNLRTLLGEGGYASVYLAESMEGDLKAIKSQRPASSWEFYILKQIEKRLHGKDVLKSIIACKEIHLFEDESYLVLDYINKGTILDIVNLYRSNGQNVDEHLVIFLTIELLKVIESLHSINIIHGDLKPDNCMLRFNDASSDDKNKNSRGIKLIDFGRSIDMTLFPKNSEFRSSWKTDQQDCSEMREGKTWTYQADYYGIAGIIHTMLFGSFIETAHDGGKYKLANSLKRYWQQELWEPLFDTLINSSSFGKLPITDQIKDNRLKFEEWLEKNGSPLIAIIRNIETGIK